MENNQELLQTRIKEILGGTGTEGAREKVFQMVLYCSDIMVESKETGTTEMKRVKEIDRRLCALWRRILDPAYQILHRSPPGGQDYSSGCVVS